MAVLGLTRAAIDPGGITRMLQILERLEQTEPSKVEQWFASHPMATERVTNVERIIGETPGATAMTRNGKSDLAAYDQLRQRLAALPPAPKDVKQP